MDHSGAFPCHAGLSFSFHMTLSQRCSAVAMLLFRYPLRLLLCKNQTKLCDEVFHLLFTCLRNGPSFSLTISCLDVTRADTQGIQRKRVSTSSWTTFKCRSFVADIAVQEFCLWMTFTSKRSNSFFCGNYDSSTITIVI